MYKKHSAINTPNQNNIVWKYFTLYKFEYLIEKSSLYFTRADRFSDKSEGALAAKDAELLDYIIPNKEEFENKERLRTYLNCWIQCEHELYLMWNAYSSLSEGIAIKTTIGKLIEGCETDDNYVVNIGSVEYIDLDFDIVQNEGTPINLLKPFFTKRKEFKQEEELRLMYFDDSFTQVDHFDIPVSLNCILTEVYISPDASPDFEEYIRNLLRKNGFENAIVRKSKI